MDRPTKLSQLFLNVRQRIGQCCPAVRIRRSLRQNPLALHFQRLTLTFTLSVQCMSYCGVYLGGGGLRLLLFHGFALPST